MSIHANTIRPYDLLPERWRGEAFIAGGFAAYPALASDIDLWVSVPVNNSLDDARQEILDHLSEQGHMFQELQDGRVRHDGIEVDNYGTGLATRKVAMVLGERVNKNLTVSLEKQVHIIVTNGGLLDVLESFDISTHQVGVLANGKKFHGAGWTPLDVEPVKLKDTPTTDARLEKISARYASFRRGTVLATQ